MKLEQTPAAVLLLGIVAVIISGCSKPRQEFKLDEKYLSESTQLYVPNDLEVTLWAESPQFFNPTNMDVDARGRIWVTEAVNYRLFNNDSSKFMTHHKGDRVMILEDTDGDGKADASKVFVQDKDLTSPLGISVIGNKVIVSCAPSIIVYTDEDGDDKPDNKEIFLTGFGGFDHDHGLHAMFAGPDGRYYFNAGNAGPHIVTDKSGWTLRAGSLYNGGSPYMKHNEPRLVSDDGKMWVGGIALRVNSDGTGLTVLGHNFRNSYEFTLDSYGNMWQNDNDDDGNKGVRVSWLMEGGNMGYFSADGSRKWQADRRPGQGTVEAHWHQADPGVIPLGDSTGSGSPTGVAFYESDLLGEKYQGMLLAGEAGRNVILAYRPEEQGAGYTLKRHNLITSLKEDEVATAKSRATDGDEAKWFRPSDVVIGTDGAIYVSDWFDSMVGGHRMTDTIGRGRIYRITPKGKTLTAPKIDLTTTKGQIAALLNPAVNVRNSGFVLLAAQGDKVIDDVKGILDSDNPYHQARAIWLLANLGSHGVVAVEGMLDSDDPNLRITAFRALREVKSDIIPYARQLSEDSSPAVRRAVAVALRDLPLEDIQDIVVELASRYEGGDRYYVEALGLALSGKEDAIYPVLEAKLGGDPLKWSEAFADIAWRLHPKAAIAALEQRAASTALSDEQRQKAMVALAFIDDQEAVNAMEHLMANSTTGLHDEALWWLRYRQRNTWRNFDMPSAVLQAEVSPELQEKMLKLKQKLENSANPIGERVKAARAMANDKTGGEMLIGLAAEKKLPKAIIAEVSKVIFDNPEQSVRVLAGDYFQKPGVVKTVSIPKIAAIAGDAAKGKAVFESKCTTCHRIGKLGATIGPDLSMIGKKFEKSGLLDAIINPSAGMSFGYEMWLITKKDGTTVSGFLQADAETVVLKGMDGKLYSVKAEDIASRKQFETSIMPPPSALALGENDLADLSEYLLTLDGN